MLLVVGYVALASWFLAYPSDRFGLFAVAELRNVSWIVSERAKRVLWFLLIVAVCVCYLGAGYYFGVVNRPARHQVTAPENG